MKHPPGDRIRPISRIRGRQISLSPEGSKDGLLPADKSSYFFLVLHERSSLAFQHRSVLVGGINHSFAAFLQRYEQLVAAVTEGPCCGRVPGDAGGRSGDANCAVDFRVSEMIPVPLDFPGCEGGLVANSTPNRPECGATGVVVRFTSVSPCRCARRGKCQQTCQR